MKPIVGALGVGLLLLIAREGAALSPDDCEDWLQQLEGEVDDVDISGADVATQLEALQKDLRAASLERDGAKRATSLKNVDSFRKRAAELTTQGRLSRMEGERLDTLSDTPLQRALEDAR